MRQPLMTPSLRPLPPIITLQGSRCTGAGWGH